ncbi:LysR substrate-binding domain-containing protein [Corallococcus carmarthensis]|uniref:LysR substrate-binding domain-containing protein n=1 Tax=Corallococcus carmarthensis TaxID=2316728 RepID=A0A3A8KIU7_9BACT|nr:LysR substrate-binding domain-containing protein [Corallococcus carmarthensis]RKH07029.1 hypothetical protein D7X32_02835 [Corallococcus carmarthensis]
MDCGLPPAGNGNAAHGRVAGHAGDVREQTVQLKHRTGARAGGAIEREPCLAFPREGFRPTWRFRDARGHIHEVPPRTRVAAAGGLLLKRLALDGAGLTLLPRWMCAEELAAGTRVDLFPAYDVTATEFDATVSVVYPSRSFLPAKVRVFVDHLAELFKNGPPWESAPRQGGGGRPGITRK